MLSQRSTNDKYQWSTSTGPVDVMASGLYTTAGLWSPVCRMGKSEMPRLLSCTEMAKIRGSHLA